MKQKRANLVDIAQEVGVSTATASRILNNRDRSDPETRARVFAVAKRLGYTLPKDSKRQNGNRAISVIMDWGQRHPAALPSSSSHGSFDHLQRMLMSIEQTCQTHGYHLMLNSAGSTADALPSSIQAGAVEGALLLGGQFADDFVTRVADEVPMVFVASHLPRGDVHAVRTNYVRSAAQAVDYLVEQGHRRIALLNGPHSTHTSADKLAGYLQRCYAHALSQDQSLIIHADGFYSQDGLSAAHHLFEHAQFSAIIGGTDILSLAAIQVAHERGLGVPEQLSVVSLYNADAPMKAGVPTLTGVQVAHERIGQIAAERLLALIEQPQPPTEIIVPTAFKIGTTSGPVPASHNEAQSD